MRHTSLLAIVFACFLSGPALADVTHDASAALPKSAWYLFQDKNDFPGPFRDAAPAVIAEAEKNGLLPERYFLHMEYGARKSLLLFHLWELGMFPIEPHVMGDPTGKCRTIEYDIEKKGVVKIYGWK